MTRRTWPEADDEAGWVAAAAEGLRDCPPRLLAQALRALVGDGDAQLVEAMTLHFSDHVTRRLLESIGPDHADGGEDVVAQAHAGIMAALFDPASTDGPDLDDLP